MTIQINGTSGISGVDGSAATPALQGTDTNTGISFGTDEVNIVTDGTTRATVDDSGRLLVGTSTDIGQGQAQFKEHVHVFRTSNSTTAGQNVGIVSFGDARGGAFAQIQALSDDTPGTDDYPGRLVFSTTANSASSPTERMRIASDGGASFFATAAAHGFRSTQNAGTDTTLFVATGATSTTNGTVVTRIRSDGDLENSNNSYGPLASDERLKQDIVDIGSQWDDIKNIRLTKFRFKNNPTGDLQLGPIAQELEQVCPGLITRRPAFENEIADPSNDLVDGDEVLSFKASILYMKAVGALQEAMERIEQLETRLTALEGGTNP